MSTCLKNNINLFLLFIFALNLALVTSSELTPKLGLFSPGYLMHIVDALPNGAPPLTLRCQDKHHDLGNQTINVSQEFRFKFNGQIFGGTLYFCHFYWNGRDKVFDVFNDNISGGCGSLGAFLSECYWKALEIIVLASTYPANFNLVDPAERNTVGARLALSGGIEERIKKIEMECDSKLVVDWIKNKTTPPWSLWDIINSIRDNLKQIGRVENSGN
ncbi:hypothetical protein HAX54_014650 [Datura stramonium]|uniref:S-protein homolog n=1 Tax=Datura stramonium TaxID=4076 RepID=A0ABS8TR60_DATST|nr:hypothetical protein [Datura stramonium]